MELKELKEHIKGFKPNTEFKYGLSLPFSWRGSYAEVGFEILKEPSTREEILDKIELAYTETFMGYKGGDYTYNDNTDVNFEEDTSSYTDGAYCARIISEIEGSKPYLSEEARLVGLAFTE